MKNNLIQRTFDFAVMVGKMISLLPDNRTNRVYFFQLIRCSSSVGANYRASQRAKSGKDFINKLKITEEETDETIYFLELLQALDSNYHDLIQPVIEEGTEILKIIVASINKMRLRLQHEMPK